MNSRRSLIAMQLLSARGRCDVRRDVFRRPVLGRLHPRMIPTDQVRDHRREQRSRAERGDLDEVEVVLERPSESGRRQTGCDPPRPDEPGHLNQKHRLNTSTVAGPRDSQPVRYSPAGPFGALTQNG